MEKVAVLGIGRLGLCFALQLEAAGYYVYGLDVREDYISSLVEGAFVSAEPGVNAWLAKAQHFFPGTSLDPLDQDSITKIFVMVATPSTPEGDYDHSQVENIARQLIRKGKRKNTTDLVIGCTTMPGYCSGLQERLRAYNYELIYNPEFIAQGSILRDQQYPDQVLIGTQSGEAGERIKTVYKRICRNEPAYHIMDLKSAEICKLATNCFLTTKISFANSIGDLAVRVGADPNKILEAIGADSRIGNKYLKYGYGFGGPCFPRDNRALGHYSEKEGFELLIGKATDEVNRRHLDFQFEEIQKKQVVGEAIRFDHVSYKKGSTSIEESQQLQLAVKLANAGRSVMIADVPEVIDQVRQLYGNLFLYEET